MSCLLTQCVSGYSRVPEPPARTMPLRMGDDGFRTAGAEAFSLVRSRTRDGLAPGAVGEVPAHGFFQAGRERFARPPAQVACNLGMIDGVPPIVAGTIRDVR